MHFETTSHDKLQAVLDLAGLELRASEVHGMVCGEICRQSKLGIDPDFLGLLCPADAVSGPRQEVWEAVEELMDQSKRALNSGMEFSLLLPEDHHSIDERTASLADWARGFTIALLRGSQLTLEDLDGDSGEVVEDFLKISEAQSTDGSEEDERAFMEIEEYMRVGVQLVFEGLQPHEEPKETNRSVH